MNDEFMHQLYGEPRAGFADALYGRISQQPPSRFASVLSQRLTLRNSAILFALLFLVAACVYAVTERGWHKVGGIWVDVERTYKPEMSSSYETSTEASVQPQEPKCLTVEEARKILSFDLHVPTWAPEDFTFDNKVCGGINELSDFAGLYWEGPEKNSGISIQASNLRWFNIAMQKYEVGPPYLWMPVAPGSYKEVQVHGQPAVLVRGDWDFPWRTGPTQQKTEFKWDKKLALQLYWVDGEVMYQLYTPAKVSVEDLIKMAESTQ